MRKLLAIWIAVSFLLQCTVQFAVLAAFELRKDYIARNLCENRNKPQMKCCGKCVLNKQLKKVSTGDNTTRDEALRINLMKTSPCLLPQTYTPACYTDIFITPVRNPVCRSFTDRLTACTIFHPPSPAAA